MGNIDRNNRSITEMTIHEDNEKDPRSHNTTLKTDETPTKESNSN